MTIVDIPPEAKPAVRLRQRREIDELDYRRELLALVAQGYKQREIASWLRIAQPTLSEVLKTAQGTPMPREGFSGASPLEICRRYAAGLISRSQILDELTRWEYAPGGGVTDGFDTVLVDEPGSFDEVERAAVSGLIDSDIYDEVLQHFVAVRAAAAGE